MRALLVVSAACAVLCSGAVTASGSASAVVPAAAASPAGEPAATNTYIFHEVSGSGGVPINVVETGNPEGPAVVLLHGFSQSYLSWLEQLDDPALASELRLVAVDLRGHGASGKPWDADAYAGYQPWADDIAAVLQTLEIEQPWLVGWSFGGYVALDFVRGHGEDAVAGVMLVASHGGLVPRPPGEPAEVRNDLLEAIENARGFMALMNVQPVSQAAIDRGVFSHVMLPPYVRRAMTDKRLDNADLFPMPSLPVMMILGEDDLSLPVDNIRKALPAGADIEIVVYPGVGHSPFVEAPERFNADLLRRIAGNKAGTPSKSSAP